MVLVAAKMLMITNFFEGFLSGLVHPVIGLDHLAFVIAIGLIAAGQINGAIIPAGLILAARNSSTQLRFTSSRNCDHTIGSYLRCDASNSA